MNQEATLPRAARRFPGDAVIAMILAALTFVVLTPYLDASMLSIRASVEHMPDEGTILSNADRVSRGEALYRDVFDFKGPISYLPYVVAYKIAPPTARTGRLTMFAILSLWAATMFEVARRITRSRILAVMVALWVPFQIWQAWTYAYQDFTAQLLLVLGVLGALSSFELASPRAPSGWRQSIGLITSGTCCALALWTSLAQGLTGMAALWAAVVFVAWTTNQSNLGESFESPAGRQMLAGGRRAGRAGRAGLRAGGSFGLGVLLGSLGVFAWLASMGAVRAGLQAMLIFPFTHYQASNETTYGYDAPGYAALWAEPRWISVAAQTILKATEAVPFVALAIGATVAGGLLVLLVRPRLRFRWSSDLVARVVLPASLAATALPVVLSQTRSDICHIGFVEGGCIVAILSVFAIRPAKGTGAWFASTVQRVVGFSLGGTLLMAVAFYVHTLRVKPAGYVDLDAEGVVAFDGDLIAARTRPQDRVFVTEYGGWQYLYSRRNNATSFAFLADSPYSDEQWPVAAQQIVAHRPRLLLVSENDLRKLVAYDHQIGAMYFGFPGNYMLDERGEGPPFRLPASWEFAGDGITGEEAGRLHVTIRADGGSARLLAWNAAREVDMRAAIHGNLVSLFDGDDSYVGALSADGTRIQGTRFTSGGGRHPFAGRRIEE